MQDQLNKDIRELEIHEIELTSGGANPWLVRIVAKLIVAAIDHVAENGLEGRSLTRPERETGNRI